MESFVQYGSCFTQCTASRTQGPATSWLALASQLQGRVRALTVGPDFEVLTELADGEISQVARTIATVAHRGELVMLLHPPSDVASSTQTCSSQKSQENFPRPESSEPRQPDPVGTRHEGGPMTTQAEAVDIARAHLRSLLGDAVVLEDQTLEYDFGWVIFYNNAAFAESRNGRDGLAGNAPLIVDRTTGNLSRTGTAQPIEAYIEAYRRYGDPHARPGKEVRLLGWVTGALAVSAIKIVRARSRSTLAEAKRCVEQVLDGGSACFEAESVDAAAAAVSELQACGFRAEQLRSDRVA